MGARVYIPSLGRFLQVDPVDGGTLNGYVYVADPINASDYNGQWGFGDLFSAIVNVVKAVIKAIATPIAAVVRAMTSAANSPKAAASSGSNGNTRGSTSAASSSGSRAGGSTASANLSRPSTILGPAGTDIFYIKNLPTNMVKPGPSSSGVSGSYCWFACIGGGVNSAGRPSVIFGVGPEVGFNAGAYISSGAANTGWEFGVECTAVIFTVEIGTGGVGGGINAIPGKVGCGVKGSYTW
jgi:hypothetical protein